jgi:hypothetical protein
LKIWNLVKRIVSIIHHLKTQKIHNLKLMWHGVIHIVNNMMEFLRLNIFFNSKTPYPNTKEWMIQLIQNQNHQPTNIWNDNIDNEINDWSRTISITNTTNIEQHDLWFDFVI